LGTHDTLNLAIDVDHLVRRNGILDQLEGLLPEEGTTDEPSSHPGKITGSPAPWNAEAAAIYFDITEGARRLEASLRRDVSGRLGERRGNSTPNTRSALRSVVRLTEALDDDRVKTTTRIVARWVTTARQLRDIDQADPWEPLPRLPGHLPPACDYCSTYSLRWNRRSGEVRCVLRDCRDGDGKRPIARMEIGRFTGQAALVWRDGRSVTYATETAA
jgi:hypothetical protein